MYSLIHLSYVKYQCPSNEVLYICRGKALAINGT